MRINPSDYIGNTYGYLTVLKVEINETDNQTYAICECKCKNTKKVLPYQLKNGSVVSCGCLKKKLCKNLPKAKSTNNGNYLDGRSKHPLYGTWVQILSRCENPQNSKYEYYGGRGIKVCEEWRDFWKFVEWSDSVGGRPKGYTIDRKDGDKDYEPSNCHWVDWKTQQRNKQNNMIIEYNGESKTIAEWSEELNIHQRTLSNRIHRGWTIERAFTQEVQRHNKGS